MPFDVNATLDNFGNSILSAPIVNRVAGNPIWTALTITFIIVLIIMFVFRHAETDDSLLVTSLRAGFWTFLLLACGIFLHNKVLMREKEAVRSSGIDKVFTGNYEIDDMFMPVNIHVDFSKEE